MQTISVYSDSRVNVSRREFFTGAEARIYCTFNVALKGHSSTDGDTATLDLL